MADCRLVSLALYQCQAAEADPVELVVCDDLSFASFFVRGNMRENVRFQSRVIAGRTQLGSKQSVDILEGLGKGHAWAHPQGIAAVAFITGEYPMRVVFGLLDEVVQACIHHRAGKSEDFLVDAELRRQTEKIFQRYQHPEETDSLMRTQATLEEIHGEVQKSIESLLRRGESLDALIDKSQELSNSSKKFARMAEQNNGCLQWLRKMLQL